MKRIRSALEGLRGGLLPPEVAVELAPQAYRADLARLLRGRIKSRINDHLTALDIDAAVRSEKEALDREWSDSKKRLHMAPGEEILAAVFNRFGSEYKKSRDAVRIAKHIGANDLPSEIQDLIREAVSLADRH